MKYKFLDDLTSDVLFEAYGKNLKELFENSAEALFSIVCKINKVNPEKRMEFEFSGSDLEQILFNFLSKLLAETEINEFFPSKFNVSVEKTKNGYKGKVTAWGEPISQEKGETVVKAVTYYKFKVEKNELYKATVSCDI